MKSKSAGWVVDIPGSVIAPLGAYILISSKGKEFAVPVQGPLPREQEDDHNRRLADFAGDLGRLAAELYLAGKLGCLEHKVCPLDIVVDTPAGTFAACSLCHAAGVYGDVTAVRQGCAPTHAALEGKDFPLPSGWRGPGTKGSSLPND